MADHIQCFDGDGIKHPTLAGTVTVERCDVMHTYQGRGLVKLRLFCYDPDGIVALKRDLRSVANGADWFQIIVLQGRMVVRQSFYDLTIDAIQQVYDGVQCRIHYDRAEPPIKTYVQPRHRDKKYDWSITNP